MKYLSFILIVICFISCKKAQQQIQTNYALQAITDGQWKVTSYKQGTGDSTAAFAAYKFQFKTNYTVDAIKNGIVENTGTWIADLNAQTITSNFNNPLHPLELLNGTWQITNSSQTFVEAKMNVNNELRTLRLDKQ
jgi:hypothetical protein